MLLDHFIPIYPSTNIKSTFLNGTSKRKQIVFSARLIPMFKEGGEMPLGSSELIFFFLFGSFAFVHVR